MENMEKIPTHVGFIMDGNGRWAKKYGMPRTFGHEQGLKTLLKTTNDCLELGIKELTVFAFSTENWNRDEKEVEYLMSAPVKYFEENREKWNSKNVKIVFVGRKDRFPTPTLDAINKIMLETENNTALTLNVAFDYGGRYDILETTKIISSRVKEGLIDLEDITESYISQNLNVINDVDLLIRTSGELRVSNFLLWQMAYSEFYFAKCLWPDFNKKELVKAILSFQKRNRRFGSIRNEVK